MDRTLWPRLSWRLLLYWAVLLGSVWAFAELTDEVYEQEGFFFDEPVLGWFYGLITPLRTRVALALSTVGGVEVMVGLTALITLLLWFRSRREAVFFAASMVGASAIMGLTKVLLARPRPELFPDVDLWQTGSSSFPSGHATGSAALALTLYLVVSRLAPRWRALAAVLGLAFALSVSASRLYLQVHYPSDVLAGLALGCAWVLGVNASTATPAATARGGACGSRCRTRSWRRTGKTPRRAVSATTRSSARCWRRTTRSHAAKRRPTGPPPRASTCLKVPDAKASSPQATRHEPLATRSRCAA